MRANRKGRSKGTGAFTLLPHFMQDTPAWRSLSPQARAVYLEVARLYNGKNNGFIGLGVRAAGERANVNKDTAGRCLKALVDRGFIEVATPSSFRTNGRLAAEWRLTSFKCDRTQQPPSKAFVAWRPEPDSPKASPLVSDSLSPDFGHKPQVWPVTVPRLRTLGAA